MKLRSVIFGSPIPSADRQEQKLGLFSGFAILSSNALSSVAYATGEIFIVLAAAGSFAIAQFSIGIAIAVVLLILLMGFSYAQVIKAHPEGGGSYSVVKGSFGERTLLLTSASLVIDYILTVAVSISTASLAITSAFPIFADKGVEISLVLLVLIMVINLRGVKSTAKIFVWPTYIFVLAVLIMVVIGLYKYYVGSLGEIHYTETYRNSFDSTLTVISMTVVLRAFSSGSSALTGIESYANGVATYKDPILKRALMGLSIMIALSIVMFFCVTFLGAQMNILPDSQESALSQIAHEIFGGGAWYYFLQIATCFILLMAANTCFTGFPHLAAIMSKDRYLPKQLQKVGDRFAFKNGIIFLTCLSGVLIVLFKASVTELIPLYAFGVFVAFTLCQAGLIKYWYANKRYYKSWGLRAFLNTVGCIATGLVVVIIIESKFFEGIWIVIGVIPIIMYGLYQTKKHYESREKNLSASVDEAIVESSVNGLTKPKVVLLVSRIHRGTIEALRLARNISDDITPVYVSSDEQKIQNVKKQWKALGFEERLLVLRPMYNSFIAPVLQILHKNDLREPERGYSVVILPEVVNTKWWHFLLHNQNSRMIKLAIAAMDKRDKKTATRVVISVPYKAE